MKRFVHGLKNSQKIRVTIRYPEQNVDFSLYTTVQDVFRGGLGKLSQSNAVMTTLTDMGPRMVRGTVQRHGNMDVQVDIL